MTTMAKTINRVSDVDVSGKIDQIADLVRHLVRKGMKEGTIDAAMLECVVENGGLFQERVLPVMLKIGTIGRVVVDSELLGPITTVSVPGVEAFSAKTRFVTKNTPDNVSLGYISLNFQSAFLNGTGRNEIDVPKAELRIHKLRQNSVDAPIIEELGGNEQVETSLSTMWEMMKRQGQGQRGDLLVNGYYNIFYIRDDYGTLWAVGCWISDYRFWCVDACSVACPSGWHVDDRVFTR
jgi:hypothetical protein